MARSKSKLLPKFESLDELVEFFDNHDMGEYWDQMPEVDFEVDIKSSKRLVAIDEKIIPRLNKLAKSKKVSTEKLINDWLKKKVATSEQVNQIQRPHLIVFLDDFRQAHKFAAYILEKGLHDKNKTELQRLTHLAFNTSLIVSYSRPFSSNHFPRQPKLSLKEYVSKVLKDEDDMKLHEWVIGKRDQEYGHSDSKSHLFEDFDYSGKHIELMKISFMPLDKSGTQRLKIMIGKWIKYLKEEQSKLRG